MEISNRIRVGIICECNKGSDFGWLYSYYGCLSICGEKPLSVKLFYIFKKAHNYSANNGTVVAFISIDDLCGHAVNVTEINEIPFLYAESDDDVKQYRKNNLLPYWEIHYPWRFDYCCLVYPDKINNSELKELYYTIPYGKDLEIFMLLYSIHKLNFQYLTLEKIALDLAEIKNYVKLFSIEQVLETYRSGESGYFQSRPGRDDSFITTAYKEIDINDEFIRSMLPLGEEIDSYPCVGRGLDDNDYNTINIEETEAGKKIVREKYSKELHLTYLISLYYEKYHTSKN